jgi:hypothetical protein
MQQLEPLYYGVDVDAVVAQMDAEDRRRAEARRAAARRSRPRRSPWLDELETNPAVDALIDPGGLAPRGTPLA